MVFAFEVVIFAKPMKKIFHILIVLVVTGSMGMNSRTQEIELECVKRQHATKMCHYNFLVDGIPHRYIDYGCKEKKADIVKKAKEGKLALAKEWKIECPQRKEKPD